MNIDVKQIAKLLNDALEKYDDPSFLWAYMRGVSDALDAVNSCIGSKEDAKEGRKETDEKNEPETSLYYEPLSGRYFSMPSEDFTFILNEVMTSDKKSMTVNEWFSMLGLEPLVLSEHYYWPIINGNFAYVTPGASDKAPEWCIHYNNMPILKTK